MIWNSLRLLMLITLEGDYPNEKYLSMTDSDNKSFPLLYPKDRAEKIAELLNAMGHGARWWMVKPEDYVLQPGFEP